MGIVGSKEELGQIVVIYGYNQCDFGWKKMDGRSIYRTSGIIIDHYGKKYVVTTRTRLISCQSIVMYHCYFSGSEPIMRNDLQILFQSIEYNIIILGTSGFNELNLSMSEVLYGTFDLKGIYPSIDITKKKYIRPSKKANYQTIKTDLDIESSTIKYDVHIFDAKFIGSVVYDQSYVPDTVLYKFFIPDKKDSLIGIYGSPIFNRKHEMVGIVTKIEDNNLYVLPAKTLLILLNESIANLNIPHNYCGPQIIPFIYQVLGENAYILEKCEILTTDGPFLLKPGDKIVSVGNNDILIENDKIMIFDHDLKEYIALDVYLRINLVNNTPIDIILNRKKKILNIKAIGTKMDNILTLTDQPYYYPKEFIPYVICNDIIIVQLTQELLDTMLHYKINLKNKIIDDFLENSLLERDCLLLVDCLDEKLSKKYILPQLVIGQRETIACPYIVSINDVEVRKLDEFNTILKKNKNKIKLTIKCYNDEDQYDIYLD